MKAVRVEAHGGPEALELGEAPPLSAGAHEVLIDVAYCGCNWADTMIRSGVYPNPMPFPLTLGVEVSGVVAELGAGVRELAVGDRVCAILPAAGGYAERAAAATVDVMPIPDGLSLRAAAAFPIQGLTAYHMLHTVANVRAGDHVLCHAVGGGVGLFVAQLARRAAAPLLGTTGTQGKEVKALEYGAERVVNTATEDFVEAAWDFSAGRGIDVALDSLGASTLDRTFTVMRKLGHVINIGEAEGLPYGNIRDRLLPTSASFTRFHLQHVGPGTALWRKGVDFVVEGLLDGWLRAPIADVFPLERVREMHEAIESRQVAGKLLLAVNEGLR